MKNFLLIILIMILSVVGCQSNSQQENPFEFDERTYYESLDLSTPEQAVITFTDAFDRDDFFTVWLVLSPSAQFRMTVTLNTFHYHKFIHADYIEDIRDFRKNDLYWGDEHFQAGWYLFDGIMYAANEHSALLIDLCGKVTILDTQPTGSNWVVDPEESSLYRVDNPTDVVTNVEGIEGEVIFRTVQVASDRWRVLQVIVPGGDEEIIPWSAPSTAEALSIKDYPKPPTQNPRIYYESLDLSSPEKTVRTFTDAYKKRDFLTVYLVLSKYAQWKILDDEISFQSNYPIIYEKRRDVLISALIPISDHEHNDPWYSFDQMMLWANYYSSLLLDFDEKITIIESKPSESQWAEDTIDVVISMEYFDGEIIFRTVQAPSGRWRVLQVILPGGDEEKVPWAVPPQNE